MLVYSPLGKWRNVFSAPPPSPLVPVSKSIRSFRFYMQPKLRFRSHAQMCRSDLLSYCKWMSHGWWWKYWGRSNQITNYLPLRVLCQLQNCLFSMHFSFALHQFIQDNTYWGKSFFFLEKFGQLILKQDMALFEFVWFICWSDMCMALYMFHKVYLKVLALRHRLYGIKHQPMSKASHSMCEWAYKVGRYRWSPQQ